jgi:hypothetical protein
MAIRRNEYQPAGWLLLGNPVFDNALLNNLWFIKTIGISIAHR